MKNKVYPRNKKKERKKKLFAKYEENIMIFPIFALLFIICAL